jgi:hypothetical protein
MIGPVVVGAALLYLAIAIMVVRLAIRYARTKGRSAKRWGWSAVLVMYLIPFWDWLPTVAVHQYYCATEAGFWVYKTLDQWKAENPGVAETLVANKGAPSRHEPYDNGNGKRDTYFLNQRFRWIVDHQDISRLLPIIRINEQVFDATINEILGQYIDFATGTSVKNTVGPPGPFKFWLYSPHCLRGGYKQDALRNFGDYFRGAKE